MPRGDHAGTAELPPRRGLTLDDRQLRLTVLALLGLGLLIRLVVAATTAGSLPDLAAFRTLHVGLEQHGFGVYGALDDGEHVTWPYLSGSFPLLEALWAVSNATGISFERLVRTPQIAADLAIAWLVQWHLGWRGATNQVRAGATAVLAFSPVGIAVTGAHGQIDPLEWLPVVAALIAWERLPEERRALVAGVLIGIGVAIKSPAALAVVVFLALASTWRERAVLLAAVATVPLLAILPFLLAAPEGVLAIAKYSSLPGQGGLSMIVQPDLALARFAGTVEFRFTTLSETLQDAATVLLLLGLAPVVACTWIARPEPASALSAVILASWVANPNFVPFYAIWIIPFLILAGWWRFLAAFLALVTLWLPFKYLPASVVEALGVGNNGLFDEWLVIGVYIVSGALLWALMAGRVVLWVRSYLPHIAK